MTRFRATHARFLWGNSLHRLLEIAVPHGIDSAAEDGGHGNYPPCNAQSDSVRVVVGCVQQLLGDLQLSDVLQSQGLVVQHDDRP